VSGKVFIKANQLLRLKASFSGKLLLTTVHQQTPLLPEQQHKTTRSIKIIIMVITHEFLWTVIWKFVG